jgi:hypothetical protein
MQKRNFEAAIPFLTKSITSYSRAAEKSEFIESRMSRLQQQAETETWLAGALLNMGRKERAIDALNHAITQLTAIEQNNEIQDAIRASARRSLQEARAALELTSKN